LAASMVCLALRPEWLSSPVPSSSFASVWMVDDAKLNVCANVWLFRAKKSIWLALPPKRAAAVGSSPSSP